MTTSSDDASAADEQLRRITDNIQVVIFLVADGLISGFPCLIIELKAQVNYLKPSRCRIIIGFTELTLILNMMPRFSEKVHGTGGHARPRRPNPDIA